MTSIEPPLKGQFVTFVNPKPLNYGFTDKKDTRKELYSRVQVIAGSKKIKPREVQRYLYPLQLVGYLRDNLLQMINKEETSLVQTYTAIDMPNGAILYIEDVEEELFIFVVSPSGNVGFSDLCRLI